MNIEIPTKPAVVEQRPIVIIDGMNIFIRSFVVNEATTASGDPCGGVVGFLKSLNWITNNLVPSKIYVVWEQGGGSPRRKKIFPGYKANRIKIRSEFSDINKVAGAAPSKQWIMNDTENKLTQVKQLVEVCKNLPICQLYVPDCEGDDVVSYMVKNKLANEDTRKIVVSNDKDFYQLLTNKSVMIYDPATKVFVDGDNVFQKFGIAPRNFALARTLIGDPSDNIPGVPGIAFKTAQKRFTELADKENDHSVADLLESCRVQVNAKTKIRTYAAVLDCKEIVERNWQIMYLDSSDLSGQQIQKINYVVDNFQPKMDKLGMIKCLLSAGIVTDLNFDRMAQQMKNCLLSS